jgi:hypothetical protein
MMKYLTAFFAVLFSIFSAVSQAPKYSNEFLNIGVGARSLAMARSVVAICNNGSASYWNPAGLAAMDRDFDLGLMHVEYPNGIAKYDYYSAATRIIDSTGTVGISVIRLGVDDIPNTLELIDSDNNINYNRVTYFSYADYAFLLSFARAAPVKGLLLGGNVKIIRRIIGEFATAWGFGIDVGAQYQLNEWRLGVVGRDITSTFNAWKINEDPLTETFEATGNELPQNSIELTLPGIRAGAARNLQLFKHLSLLGEVDVDIILDGKRNELIKTKFGNLSPHFGLEMNYDNAVFVRVGLGNFYRTNNFDRIYTASQPTMGIGLHFLIFDIDYAITDFGQSSNTFYSHIFSMNIAFNKIRFN